MFQKAVFKLEFGRFCSAAVVKLEIECHVLGQMIAT